MARRATTVPCDFAFSILFQNAFERQSLYERPPTNQNEAVMSRRALLSPEQRIRLFGIPVDQAEMARHYVLSAEDLAKDI
jgi:hypothetical protein